MPVSITVPNSGWSEQTVNLNGISYTFIFGYNSRTKRLDVDIYFDNDPVELGIPIMESGAFFGSNQPDNFDHGDIQCVRIKNDFSPATLGNVGLNNNYELIYFSNAELGREE